MKRTIAILAVMTMVVLSGGRARAGTVAGPASFGSVGGSDTYWGIQFDALTNSTLTGFDYNHRGPSNGNQFFTGTITVNDITSSTQVYTTNYGTSSPDPIAYSGLAISLVAGHTYQLIASSNIVFGTNDELFAYTNAFPQSDAEISVTQGVFTETPGFMDANAWGAFNNITTAGSVPEPASLALFGMGLVGVAAFARNRRTRRSA